jgi:hypothetical protein
MPLTQKHHAEKHIKELPQQNVVADYPADGVFDRIVFHDGLNLIVKRELTALAQDTKEEGRVLV